MPADLTDIELAERVVARDVDAFGALYDRHVAYVIGVSARILEDRAEAEKVV